MSRVGSSLRRLLFVEVRADPPSANGIFARNVRQIDQEALLRISYFPPRPRTKKAESARQCPNLDGALPTNVLANTFPFSLHEGRIFRNEKSAAEFAAGVSYRRKSLRPAPYIRRSRFPFDSVAAEKSFATFARYPQAQIPNHFVKPSAIEFARIAEARNGRTKFNRNGRSSDSFRLRRLPDPEVSGKRVSHTFAPRRGKQEHTAAGTVRDSHPIPI